MAVEAVGMLAHKADSSLEVCPFNNIHNTHPQQTHVCIFTDIHDLTTYYMHSSFKIHTNQPGAINLQEITAGEKTAITPTGLNRL